MFEILKERVNKIMEGAEGERAEELADLKKKIAREENIRDLTKNEYAVEIVNTLAKTIESLEMWLYSQKVKNTEDMIERAEKMGEIQCTKALLGMFTPKDIEYLEEEIKNYEQAKENNEI